MSGLWVARDEDGSRGLALFEQMPKMNLGRSWECSGSEYVCLPEHWFPDLKPGECRRLVMAEEESE